MNLLFSTCLQWNWGNKSANWFKFIISCDLPSFVKEESEKFCYELAEFEFDIASLYVCWKSCRSNQVNGCYSLWWSQSSSSLVDVVDFEFFYLYNWPKGSEEKFLSTNRWQWEQSRQSFNFLSVDVQIVWEIVGS